MLKSIIARNPYRDEAERDPGHLVVMFLKSVAKAKDIKGLQLASTGPEIIRAKGRELYIVYPSGIGRSRLTNALIERKLGTRGTARNWNTLFEACASRRRISLEARRRIPRLELLVNESAVVITVEQNTGGSGLGRQIRGSTYG